MFLISNVLMMFKRCVTDQASYSILVMIKVCVYKSDFASSPCQTFGRLSIWQAECSVYQQHSSSSSSSMSSTGGALGVALVSCGLQG